MNLAPDRQMPRPGRTCTGCGCSFAPGQALRALLYDTAQGYERRDYCEECPWPPEPAPLASWKTQRPVPTSRKAHAFDPEAVYNFFVRIEDDPRPEQAQFRFVLALVLWRKKVLKFLRSVDAGVHECWEFGVRGSEERHRVERPALDEDRLEQLSLQLEQVLASAPGELDNVADATAEEGPSG